MTDEKLPRDVPYDEGVPEPFREDYVRVKFAAEVLGKGGSTIRKYLNDQILAGVQINPRLWYVKRITTKGSEIPALDMFANPPMGNPNWLKESSKNS